MTAKPKPAKGRTWKVWVVMDGPRPKEDIAREYECYRTRRAAALQCRVLAMDGWKGLTVEPATLTLTPSRRRKG